MVLITKITLVTPETSCSFYRRCADGLVAHQHRPQTAKSGRSRQQMPSGVRRVAWSDDNAQCRLSTVISEEATSAGGAESSVRRISEGSLECEPLQQHHDAALSPVTTPGGPDEVPAGAGSGGEIFAETARSRRVFFATERDSDVAPATCQTDVDSSCLSNQDDNDSSC